MPVRTTDGDDKGARVARGFSAPEKQLSPLESLVSLGGITHSWSEGALRLMNAADSTLQETHSAKQTPALFTVPSTPS